MSSFPVVKAGLSVLLLLSIPLSAAVYTVSKTGSADYTSVQAAVDKAGPNDEIVIIDTATYEEQVVIDSTKSGLILRSENITALKKPTIKWKDIINVGPKTSAEAKDPTKLTFDRNGALIVLGAKRVRVEGIAVDGGGVFPFGYVAIWADDLGNLWPMQSGNGGISLWLAGDCSIRYCDISNAFYGINVKDRNVGGVFANPDAADIDTPNTIPFSAAFQTGNHLFEHNRIHDNSFGMYFESSWDLGSTIRYNLFYENHHPSTAIAEKVKGLTNEGENMPGGAIGTKDDLLSPLAIYNNTFWHNLYIFVGMWKAGGQHLIFNNIYAEPYVYYLADELFGGKSHLDMFKSYVNRIHNCVIAAQVSKPAASPISITNDFSRPNAEGDVITKPFPATAEIRYLEMGERFISTTPSSEGFLEPDWGDTLVEKYVIDKGWEASGVKDPDGSRADLGAIPSGGGRFAAVTTIRPSVPVVIRGTTATVKLTVVPRIDEMKNPKITFAGIVTNLDTSDVFGSAYRPIAAANIQAVTVTSAQPLRVGVNTLEVTVPASLGDFSFLEFIVEGTDSDDQTYTSAVGFIPYRKLDYLLKVTIQDSAKTKNITEVVAGTPVNLHIEPKKIDGTIVAGVLSPISFSLGSGYDLYTTAGIKIDTLTNTTTGAVDVVVVFRTVPTGYSDQILAISRIGDIPFIGSSDNIKILPDPTSSHRPPVNLSAPSPKNIRYDVLDISGRVIPRLSGNSMAAQFNAALASSNLGRGIYLIRSTNGVTGTVSIKRHAVVR